MNTEIYYFSGTGNSLHVAKELQKRIQKAVLVPIVNLLDKNIIKSRGDAVGFIFPVHLAMAPAPVIKFLKKLDLKSAEYIFAIVTRSGSQHRAFKDLKKALAQKNKNLNAYFTLNMASNDPKFEGWHRVTEEEMVDIESEVHNNLEYISDIVLNKDKSYEKDTHFTQPLPVFSVLSLFLPVLNRFYNAEFYSDSKCRGCMTCEKICLSGKIKITGEKPAWQEDVPCYLCHACLNYCPEQAVQIKSNRFLRSYTKENGRYFHPYTTAEDIAAQK